MKRAASFKQVDISRALKATKAAGLQVSRVDIHADGKISMVIGGNEQQIRAPAPVSAFDAWKAKQNASPPEGH